ncbi:MAG: cyclooxygenase [Proteobacteria bacterium]|nr:cyclooxygenase [Pseudomonadota bacterium]
MSVIDTVLKVVRKIPFVGGLLNRFATNRACGATTPRPRAFGLWSHVEKPMKLDQQGPIGEYTTWPMLTDRLYSARHLPPAEQSYIDGLPEDAPYNGNPDNYTVGDVTALFARQGAIMEGRSSVLFMFFAQWFTDSILRVDPRDRRKNTSNHNIDLCQIYGLKETTARLLRSKEKGGKLASQMIDGEEYLDYLGEVGTDGKWKVKEEYENLPYAAPEIMHVVFGDWPEERMHKLYATGLERGNSSVGYVAISTVFMREHNRICDELSSRNPDWDDERLFQTARMINNVILLKLVVQDYINHIAGAGLFVFDPTFAEKEEWYRTPWIALEFDLLYRWHGLVPDNITVGGRRYDHTEYRVNNALLEEAGLAAILDASSRQQAGRISLQNVPDFLLGAEYQMIKMGRDFRLRSYNEYRRRFKCDALTSFEQLTDDTALRDKLKAMYGDINKVEFVIGLFAQQHAKGQLYGDLMYAMVAYDAFTQIYTNPLLSRNVYTPRTFTEYGLDLIDDTNTVQDLVDRNVAGSVRVGFGF